MTWQPSTFQAGWSPKTFQSSDDVKENVPSRYEQHLLNERINLENKPLSRALGTLAIAGNAIPGLDEAISGTTAAFGGDYEDMQMRQQALREASRAKNPVQAGIVDISGPIAVGSLLPAAKIGGPIVSGAVTGGGYGSLYGLAEGDASKSFEESLNTRLSNSAKMGVTGLTLGAVLGGAGKVFSGSGKQVNDQVKSLANKAEKSYGIPLRASQISDNKIVKFVDDVTNNMPFSGAGSQIETQKKAYNKALAQLIGENAEYITPDVMASAKTRIGNALEDINTSNALQVSDEFISKLGEYQERVNRYVNANDASSINNVIDDVVSKVNDGKIDGKAFQSLRTQLGKMSNVGGEKAHYAQELKQILDEAFNRGLSGETAKLAKELRGQYRNMKIMEPVAEKAVSGEMNPALLLGQVIKNDPSFAYTGGGKIGDLAKIGKQFLQTPPSSGTAERTLASDPLRLAWSLALSPLSRATNSAVNSQYLKNILLGQAPLTSGAVQVMGAPLQPQTMSALLAEALREKKK